MIAEGFDDGRTNVPVAAAEPVERVLVVGAGIAGLTVANALAHGGVEISEDCPMADPAMSMHPDERQHQ